MLSEKYGMVELSDGLGDHAGILTSAAGTTCANGAALLAAEYLREGLLKVLPECEGPRDIDVQSSTALPATDKLREGIWKIFLVFE